jgi:hypothetical protein
MAAIRVDARASIEHDLENVGGLFGLDDAPGKHLERNRALV